jgi:hypothetical protein
VYLKWGGTLREPDAPRAGRVLAELISPSGGYCLTETDTGLTLRFGRVCEFRVDAPLLRQIRIHMYPDGDREIVPLVFAGNVLASLLSLAGRTILHASAVEYGNEGVGFLGGSGMGKSTLAALCCASGARLIADDILRLEPAASGFRCVRGPAQVRLREGAADLADRFPRAATQQTADRRLALVMNAASSDHVPLRALAVPQPCRGCRQLSLERLGRVEALYALTRYARIAGWRTPEILSRQFIGFAQVVESVPVYSARIPWGPPFPSGLAVALLDELRMQARAERAA